MRERCRKTVSIDKPELVLATVKMLNRYQATHELFLQLSSAELAQRAVFSAHICFCCLERSTMTHAVLYTSDVYPVQEFLRRLYDAAPSDVTTNSAIGYAVVDIPEIGLSVLLTGKSPRGVGAQRLYVGVADVAYPKDIAKDLNVPVKVEFTSEQHGTLCILDFPDQIEVVVTTFNESSTFAQLYLAYMNSCTTTMVDTAVAVTAPAPAAYRQEKHEENVETKTVKPAMMDAIFANPRILVHRAFTPPPGTTIPNLRPLLLHKGTYHPIHANTLTPIPFSTSLFEGQVLLLVNSAVEEKEPYASIFRDGKYKFELQIQGKFKSVPTGPIFFGGEITKKMELGMLTRGICAGLLQLGKATNAYMHHSFGDKSNFELPHITGPFWSSVDRLVVTPSGQTPPPFVASFPEDSKPRNARKNNPDYSVDVDLSSTYSFSLKTAKMDLEEWGIITSSYMKPMSLNMFWADADLRFVCYCVPKNTPGLEYNSAGLPKFHPQAKIDHFFSLEIRHISNHPEWEFEPAQIEASETSTQRNRTASNMAQQDLYHAYESIDLDDTVSSVACTPREVGAEVEADESFLRNSVGSHGTHESDDSASDDDFHDAVDGIADGVVSESEPHAKRGAHPSSHVPAPRTRSPTPPPLASISEIASPARSSAVTALSEDRDSEDTEKVSALLRDKLALLQDRIMQHSSKHLHDDKAGPFAKRKSGQGDLVISSTKLKRSLVAAVIEVDDHRRSKKGKRRTLYAFLANHVDLQDVPEGSSGSTGSKAIAKRYVLRSFGEWKDALPIVKLPQQPPNYVRLADDMKRKASLAWSYNAVLHLSQYAGNRTDLATFLCDTAHSDAFLTSPGDFGVGSKKLRVSLPPFKKESLVCVQQGNFTWSQECMGLTLEELIFIKPSKMLGTAVRLRIPIKDILSVRKVTDADNPLPIPGCCCLLVATFAKQYCIMIRGQDVRDAWLAALQTQVSYANGPASFTGYSAGITDFAEAETAAAASARASSVSVLKRSSTLDTNINPTISSSSFSLATTPASHLEGMVCYPPEWNLGDKMVLNCRNFTCSGVYHQLSIRTLELGKLIKDPCRLVEKLLDMAFKLSQDVIADDNSFADSGSGRDANTSPMEAFDAQALWVDFMDGVALLQCIDLSIVDNTSPEAACLFLNLYHCMLLHAYMVVGLPNSLFKWSNFFRHCSYEAFGDVFSLAELEHCILRSSKFPLPTVFRRY